MNKYIWCEATQDYWPTIRTISAKSYNDAVEKVQEKYSDELDDCFEFSNWEDFREELNTKRNIALSDLDVYEEI